MEFNYIPAKEFDPRGPDPFVETQATYADAPIYPMQNVGQSVTEGGRFGHFLQTATSAIRAGAGSIELATQMGGGAEAVGAESYGKETRQALRELARVNEVNITSIHSPTNIGNMSGFNPQQNSFSDEQRKIELEEVKKAIRFNADVAQGGAVVVHTGEFSRTMFDADWNQKGKWKKHFVGYQEEPERAVKHLVDDRTGRIITEVRINQEVPQADERRSCRGIRRFHGRDRTLMHDQTCRE